MSPSDPTDPLGPVVIGAREIYDLLVDMRGQLARLTDAHQEVREDIRDHETRLRVVEQTSTTAAATEALAARVTALERTRWPLPSVAALVGLAGLILALITYLTR